ncbi:MAG: response regulator, partial [Chloroflexota bacterium]
MTHKILVVDDEDVNLMVMEHLLGDQYNLTLASNGEDAMAKVHAESFDLVLLDILMPGISGLDVLRELRQSFSSDELPVVLVTALTDEKTMIEALSDAANDYLTKPLQSRLVRARVETQLQLKRQADERRQLIAQLEQANQLRNYLLRVASHDLKSPLHNTTLALSLLADHPNLTPQMTELIDMGMRSAQTMRDIVDHFLDLDILRQDGIRVDLSEINLAHVISELVLEFRGLAANKHIHIEADL